jgi:hypothetical protein
MAKIRLKSSKSKKLTPLFIVNRGVIYYIKWCQFLGFGMFKPIFGHFQLFGIFGKIAKIAKTTKVT